MAAFERPEHAHEQLVADALNQAFGGPVTAAEFHAGRDAVRAAAEIASQQAADDDAVVAGVLRDAFPAAVDSTTREAGLAAVRAAAANVIPISLHSRAMRRVGRHAVAAAIAVATLGSTSGVAAASSSALPGEALYTVKRVVERAMLTAAFTDGAEARVQTRLAERRLHEAEVLLAQGASPEAVEPLLTEYDQHVAAAVDLDGQEVATEVAILQRKANVLRGHTGTLVGGPPTSSTEPDPRQAPPIGPGPQEPAPPPAAGGSTSAGTGDVPADTTPEQPGGEAKPAQDPAPADDPATASPEPTPTPTSEPTSEPSPTATPTPTPTATPTGPPGQEGKAPPAGPRRVEPQPTPTSSVQPTESASPEPMLEAAD